MSLTTRATVFGLMLLSHSVATASAYEREKQIIEYGCHDIVAIGRVKTLSYADLTTVDDLLGRGRFSMLISIKRILRGHENRKAVPASQIAHAQLVENRDFLIVLSPLEAGNYTLIRASLWRSRLRPILAQECGNDR